MNDSNLTIRVPVELRDRFLQVCKASDVTASQVLRAAMRAYVERHAPGAGAVDPGAQEAG